MNRKDLLGKATHWCFLTVAMLTLAFGITSQAWACYSACCWHWFWGYQASCYVECNGTCTSTCSCAGCSVTCSDNDVPMEGGGS